MAFPTILTCTEGIPPVTEDEVVDDIDRIPNKALTLTIRTAPNMITQMFRDCLREGSFPIDWSQKLVLILKLSKLLMNQHHIELSAFWIQYLDRIIFNRLYLIIDSAGELSNRQFGFFEARSAIDATKMIIKAFDEGKYCAITSITRSILPMKPYHQRAHRGINAQLYTNYNFRQLPTAKATP